MLRPGESVSRLANITHAAADSTASLLPARAGSNDRSGAESGECVPSEQDMFLRRKLSGGSRSIFAANNAHASDEFAVERVRAKK